MFSAAVPPTSVLTSSVVGLTCVQCVFRVCSVCVQRVFSVCSACVQRVFSVCSACVLRVFSVCSVCVQTILLESREEQVVRSQDKSV